MARAEHKLSRRALLGAVCAAPVLTRHSGLDPESMNTVDENPNQPCSWTPDQVRGDEGRWTRALALFTRADAAVAALEGRSDDDTFDRAADAHDRALERLLLAPAPSVAALAVKLEQARRHQAWELRAGDAAMAALEQDARRLS